MKALKHAAQIKFVASLHPVSRDHLPNSNIYSIKGQHGFLLCLKLKQCLTQL